MPGLPKALPREKSPTPRATAPSTPNRMSPSGWLGAARAGEAASTRGASTRKTGPVMRDQPARAGSCANQPGKISVLDGGVGRRADRGAVLAMTGVDRRGGDEAAALAGGDQGGEMLVGAHPGAIPAGGRVSHVIADAVGPAAEVTRAGVGANAGPGRQRVGSCAI